MIIRNRKLKSFTLIEALVASVLLGVGVVGLISAATLGMRNQRRVQQRAKAMYMAEELMSQVDMTGAHLFLLGHETNGTEERGDAVYEWRIDIEQQSTGELFSVKVVVDWHEGNCEGNVELSTLLNDYAAMAMDMPTEPPTETTER